MQGGVSTLKTIQPQTYEDRKELNQLKNKTKAQAKNIEMGLAGWEQGDQEEQGEEEDNQQALTLQYI